jgi:hypothetical protein
MFDFSKTQRRLLRLVPFTMIAALAAAPAMAGTYYASPNGSSTTSCGTQASPCALSYALSSKVVAGDTVLLTAGTYSGSITLTGTKHQNLTLTADPSIVSALGTFTRGIPSGTDNRPLIAGRIQVSASGARVSYLKVRQQTSPFDGGYDGVIGVSAENVTIDHNDVWNGNQGIQVNVKRLVTVRDNHVHDLGSMTSSEDTHGVTICGSGTMASGWTEAITVANNSIHNVGGDAVQEMTNAYCSGTFRFLVISNNHLYGNQEQGFDSKGTQDLRFFGNDVHDNKEGGIIATNDPVVVSKSRWEIYNNRIHDHDNYAIAWAQSQNCDTWLIYNNLIYNNTRRPGYNYSAVQMCGDSASKFYNNVVYNNTDSGGTHSGGVADFGSGAGITNNIFFNNGLGSDDYGAIRNTSGEDSGTPSNNYIYPVKGKTGSGVTSTCMTSGNCPGFANIAAYDFHLISGSPAIDRGLTLLSLFSLDADGLLRLLSWDLGAYEYHGGSSTTVAAPTNVRIVK